MNLKKRVLRGGLSLLSLRLYSMALAFLLNGVLSRFMPQDEFASFLVGSNLVVLIGIVGMGGINQSMIRLVAGKKDHYLSDSEIIRRCWLNAIACSLPVAALFYFILSSRIGQWLDCSQSLILIILICSVLVSAHKLTATSLRSVHAIGLSSLMEGGNAGPLVNTTFLLIVLGTATGSLQAESALWHFATSLLVTVPLGLLFIRYATHKKSIADLKDPDDDDRKDGVACNDILLFSAPFMLTQVLTYFSTQFDVLIAQAYTDAESTALFGSARRLAMQPMVPMQIVTLSVSSTIAQLYAKGNREGLQRLLRSSASVGCLATVPLLLLCSLFAEPLLTIVYGEQYASGGTVFSIICVGQAVNCLTGQCSAVLMLCGHTRLLLIVKTVSSLTLATTGAWMASWYGINGLATATATVVILENVLIWRIARRQSGYWTHPGKIQPT